MPGLNDYMRCLIDDMRVIDRKQWKQAVKLFGEDEAARQPREFLKTLEGLRVKVGRDEIPVLGNLQRERISRDPSKWRSLLVDDGRYLLVKALAPGGQGAVTLARRRPKGEPETAVVLKEPLRSDAESEERFRRECEVTLEAARSGEPGADRVVHGIEVVHSGARDILVMKYVAGTPLTAEIYRDFRRPLPVRRALLLLESILQGVIFLHSRGFVHRDIKPGNLIHTDRKVQGNTVCIVDLGSVKSPDSTLTKVGYDLGTMYFTAPECFGAADGVDARADLYSVAAVLFYLLTGRPPGFELELSVRISGDDPAQVIRDTQQWKDGKKPWLRTRLDEVRPEVPAALADVVAAALHPDPSQRQLDELPLNVAEFQRRLSEEREKLQELSELSGVIPAMIDKIQESIYQTRREMKALPAKVSAETLVADLRDKVLGNDKFKAVLHLSIGFRVADAYNRAADDLRIAVEKCLSELSTVGAREGSELNYQLDLLERLDSMQRLLPRFAGLQQWLLRCLHGLF